MLYLSTLQTSLRVEAPYTSTDYLYLNLYFKSVSGFRYTGRYFSSRFGNCCRYFKISRYRFGIFGISLCVKAPRADRTILLPSQSANFDRSVSRVAGAGSSADLPVAEGGSELSSLDASNPEELSP